MESEKKKGVRSRQQNWLEDEKTLLKSIIKQHIKIIENKSTDSNTNKKKKDTWDEVCKSFNALSGGRGPFRNVTHLKNQWGHMKSSRMQSSKLGLSSGKVNDSSLHSTFDEESWSWLPDNFSMPAFNSFDPVVMEHIDVLKEPDDDDDFAVSDENSGSQSSNESEDEMDVSEEKEIDASELVQERLDNGEGTASHVDVKPKLKRKGKIKGNTERARHMRFIQFDRKMRLQLHQIQIKNEMLKQRVLLQKLSYWKKMEASLDRENAALSD